MKTIEVEIDEIEFNELNLSSTHISFDELQRKIAIKKFAGATKLMREAAAKDGMKNMLEEDIFRIVKEEKTAIR